MDSKQLEITKDWRNKNGINDNGSTFVITGDSYSIKEELKANGWIFTPILKWHKADPTGYEDRVVEIPAEVLNIDYASWGNGYFAPELKDYVEELLNDMRPESNSIYIGNVNDILKDIKVTLKSSFLYTSNFGISHIYTFNDIDGNTLVWFTQVDIPFEIGEEGFITKATIKEHKEYKGEKQTIITRAQVRKVV